MKSYWYENPMVCPSFGYCCAECKHTIALERPQEKPAICPHCGAVMVTEHEWYVDKFEQGKCYKDECRIHGKTSAKID